MITTQDLWQLEFLSDYLERSIQANESVANEQDTKNPHTKGIAFGLRLVNEDLIKVKKKLDAQIANLQQKAVSPYMIDDLTYEGGDEVESA